MKKPLEFRSAIQGDLGRIQDLYRHLFLDDTRCSPDIAEDIFVNLSKLAGSSILLGEIDKELVTSCTLVVIPNLTHGGAPYALIENVVTHTSHRGNGYGRLILQHAANQAWIFNCYKVMLMTGSTKQSTLDFYEAAGFEQSKTGFQIRRVAARKDQ